MNNNQIDSALAEVSEAILKAAETTSTYTFSPATRSIFSPENLDEKIKFLVPTDTPLRNRLPRDKGFGQATAWKKLTSKLHSNAAGGGTNTEISFADAGAPNSTSQTYSVVTAAYKLLGRKLEVGGLALAASRGRDGQPDMQAERERVKILETMLGEEELIFAGDSSVTTTQFDGLSKQVTTNSGSSTFLTVSGVNSLIQSKLWPLGASPTLLVATGRQLEALADSLESGGSIQRIVTTSGDTTGMTIGNRVSKIVNSIDGTLIDVAASRYVGNTAWLLTEQSPAGERWLAMDDLIPMSRVDVPSANYSYISFIVEGTVFKVIGEPFQVAITVGTGAL